MEQKKGIVIMFFKRKRNFVVEMETVCSQIRRNIL